MHLTVKKGDKTVDEYQFGGGPLYIGRHANSQIFLRDRAVSRQHAVIFNTQDDKWVLEDLDSANKTFLNGEAIHKAEIKNGDVVRITNFTIEIDLEDDVSGHESTNSNDTLTRTAYSLEDTLIGSSSPEPQVIVRELDSEHTPAMRLPAKRLSDFSEATEAICKCDNLDEMLLSLLDVALKQFEAYRAWCALRTHPAGPMTAHTGRQYNGQIVQLDQIKLGEKMTEAVEKRHFLVLPRVSARVEAEQGIRSAMIAPIVHPAGCFGVLYIDNAIDSDHYSLSDLDYLMLLTIHTAAVIGNM